MIVIDLIIRGGRRGDRVKDYQPSSFIRNNCVFLSYVRLSRRYVHRTVIVNIRRDISCQKDHLNI